MIFSSTIVAGTMFISALGLSYANVLTPLTWDEGAATELSKKFQPALDFDTDSCYAVTAKDIHSNYNEGFGPDTSNSKCHTVDRLSNSQAYVRRRCNHYWCAYLYAYYFEMDHGISLFWSHMHDWEHVIVWTLHDEFHSVSWSGHGKYEWAHFEDPAIHIQDSHVKVVYHLAGWGSHHMRLATENDEPPENHWGQWIIAPLVEVTWMEPWSEQLGMYDWGDAHPDFNPWKNEAGNDRFTDILRDYAPADAVNNEGFDPASDENTWDDIDTESLQAHWQTRRNGTQLPKEDL